MNKVLQKIYDTHKKDEIPKLETGDTLRVNVRIREGDKERLQAFEGIFIARNNTGMSETITVRKISFGVGVERVFPLHSPVVSSIEVVRQARVRRAKLYYLRKLRGKAARLRERARKA
ncbi:MAG: 50S ribosomal protein L19 [Acidobacteria bacterium]|nr:50S ribosomal protein L19 [Acidobacteriota bacterium]